MKNYPSQTVKKFGEDLSMCMFDADIQKSLGGLGGCKHFDITTFPIEFHPYILEYLKGNNDSVAIVFAAMKDRELLESTQEVT